MLETADSLAGISAYTRAIDCYTSILEKESKKPGPDMALNQRELSDSFLLSDVYTGLGICYEYTGRHDSSFMYYLQSYELIQNSTDTMRMARGLRNMAQLLRVMKRYDQAKRYCRQAIQLSHGIDDHRLLANIYNETAYLCELSNKLDSAKIYYQMLIDISIRHAYLKGESVGYSNMASVFEREERYEEALRMKLYALEIDQELNDQYGLMTSYVGLKDPYMKLGQDQRALDALNMALQLCDTTWIMNLSGIQLGLYEVYKYRGENKEALAAHEEYLRLIKRIQKTETEEKIAEILTRFETEKKEQQILFLEQTNLSSRRQIRLQWLLVSALIILTTALLAVGILIIKNKNHILFQMESELRHLHKNGVYKQASGKKINSDLTTREQEILHYLGQGYSNESIAKKLFISRNTVKYHIKNIYIKLDVKNRVEALIRANGG